MREILAYERPDGRIGLRNRVVVISMVSCSNTVVSRIAQATGAIPITHEYGCVEFDEDHKRTKLALVAAGAGPNVYGALLVGLGCEQTSMADVKRAVAGTGKPVEALLIQEEGGSPEAERRGIEIVRKLQAEADAQERVPCSAAGLVVGIQCGGSDWTTAVAGNTAIGAMSDRVIENGGSVLMSEVMGFPGSEHIVAANSVNRKVGLQVLDMVADLRAEYVELYGQTIEEVNPTPGNKAGGITTLVEKSMGNIRKMGNSPVQGVLRLGEPIPHPGLWVVDNRAQGPDPFNVTGFAIQGANVTVFSSGRGSPVGCAVMPVIKITGNPATFRKLESITDFNAGVVVEGKSIPETGADLYELLLEVAGGRATKSELNGNVEYAIPREPARKKHRDCCADGGV
ncbi:MAG: UxaA family hydrolase [Synergistales bacterium]|jgi:altronate dehydratase